jgi:ubiquinone/menaquinone biosynthesis C-methylase UbiE
MRWFWLCSLFCASWFLSAGLGVAQEPDGESAAEEPPRYVINLEDHDPNGIGKFYMGREIARVMGYPAADWLERPEREKEENLTKLVEALKIKPGLVVADIGAGSGRISEMISPLVGPEGKVLAVDIQDEMLALIRERARQKKLTNIELVLSTENSPKLEPGSVDLAFMVDVYHEFSYPYEMMQGLSRALKPGGRLVFVEYRKEDPKVRRMIKLVHTMTEAQVKKEASLPEFGLKWKETSNVLPVQHIIVFEKQKPDAEAKE